MSAYDNSDEVTIDNDDIVDEDSIDDDDIIDEESEEDAEDDAARRSRSRRISKETMYGKKFPQDGEDDLDEDEDEGNEDDEEEDNEEEDDEEEEDEGNEDEGDDEDEEDTEDTNLDEEVVQPVSRQRRNASPKAAAAKPSGLPVTVVKKSTPKKSAKKKRNVITLNLPPLPTFDDLVYMAPDESRELYVIRRSLVQRLLNNSTLGLNYVSCVQLADCLMCKIRYGTIYDASFEELVNKVIRSLA